MLIAIWFIIYSLAAFRLAELFVIDDGPFDVFVNLRGWAFNSGKPTNVLRRNLYNVLSCVHCTGLWISLIFGFVFYFANDVTVADSVLFALGVAGLQSIMSGNFGRGRNG